MCSVREIRQDGRRTAFRPHGLPAGPGRSRPGRTVVRVLQRGPRVAVGAVGRTGHLRLPCRPRPVPGTGDPSVRVPVRSCVCAAQGPAGARERGPRSAPSSWPGNRFPDDVARRNHSSGSSVWILVMEFVVRPTELCVAKRIRVSSSAAHGSTQAGGFSEGDRAEERPADAIGGRDLVDQLNTLPERGARHSERRTGRFPELAVPFLSTCREFSNSRHKTRRGKTGQATCSLTGTECPGFARKSFGRSRATRFGISRRGSRGRNLSLAALREHGRNPLCGADDSPCVPGRRPGLRIHDPPGSRRRNSTVDHGKPKGPHRPGTRVAGGAASSRRPLTVACGGGRETRSDHRPPKGHRPVGRGDRRTRRRGRPVAA